jgi:3-methyladenine DNA glycosylase Mpg
MTESATRTHIGAGVLLRAIEPLERINLMKQLRKTDKLVDLAKGRDGFRLHCKSTITGLTG